MSLTWITLLPQLFPFERAERQGFFHPREERDGGPLHSGSG